MPVGGMQGGLESKTHLIVQKKGLCLNTIPENGTITVQGTVCTNKCQRRFGLDLCGNRMESALWGVRVGKDCDDLQNTRTMGEASYMLA